MAEEINEAFDEVRDLLEKRRAALLEYIDHLEETLDEGSVVLFSEGNLSNLEYAIRNFVSVVDVGEESANITTEQVLARIERKPFQLLVAIITQERNPINSPVDIVYDLRIESHDRGDEGKAAEVVFHEEISEPYYKLDLDGLNNLKDCLLKVYGKAGFREEQGIRWGNEVAPYTLDMTVPWSWVPIDQANIDDNKASGGETKILIEPPVSSGVAVLEVKTLRNGNMGIGFSNHNHPNGPLAASWVGGGQESYSIWSHGGQCGGNQNGVTFVAGPNYQNQACKYEAADVTIRMVADMNNLTFTYYFGDLEAGRFENIPPEISFVAYLGSGGFEIL